MKILITLILSISSIFCYAQTTLISSKSNTPISTNVVMVSDEIQKEPIFKQSTITPNICVVSNTPQNYSVATIVSSKKTYNVPDSSLFKPLTSEKSLVPIINNIPQIKTDKK
jgi:hypothetical protein